MTMLIFDHKGLNKRTLVSYSNALRLLVIQLQEKL